MIRERMKRIALLAVLAVSATARADDRASAQQLYTAGQTAFDAKQYDVALVAWQKSFELSREPGLLFNVAQAYRLRAGAGDCASAETAYRKFIAFAPESKQRPTAERYAAEMHECAARDKPAIVVPSPPPSPPPPLAGTPESTEEPPPAPSSTKLVPVVAVGAGALVLLGAGLGFDLWGDATYNDAKAELTVQSRRTSLYDSANDKRYAAQGFAVAGIGCAAVAVWLFLRHPDDAPVTTAHSVVVSPTGIAVVGTF